MLLAVEAFGVDLKQDCDAVAGPLGDLGWGYSPVEPGRDGSMPQVIGTVGARNSANVMRPARIREGPPRGDRAAGHARGGPVAPTAAPEAVLPDPVPGAAGGR